jgi:hypothetical protein
MITGELGWGGLIAYADWLSIVANLSKPIDFY